MHRSTDIGPGPPWASLGLPHIPESFQDTPKILNTHCTIHSHKAVVCRAYRAKCAELGCKQMPGLGAYTHPLGSFLHDLKDLTLAGIQLAILTCL